MTAWDADRIGRLKQLDRDGLSAAQIALTLNNEASAAPAKHYASLTRSSVLGKIHRLMAQGYVRPESSGANKQAGGRSADWRERRPRVFKRAAAAAAPPKMRDAVAAALDEPDDDTIIDNIIPIGQRCSIFQLTEATCHWPIGDPATPEFFYCGGKAVAGLPYCSHHCHMSYQPVVDRRRDRRAGVTQPRSHVTGAWS